MVAILLYWIRMISRVVWLDSGCNWCAPCIVTVLGDCFSSQLHQSNRIESDRIEWPLLRHRPLTCRFKTNAIETVQAPFRSLTSAYSLEQVCPITINQGPANTGLGPRAAVACVHRVENPARGPCYNTFLNCYLIFNIILNHYWIYI